MPKGAISGVSDSIHPSIPNFAAAYAVQNSCPVIPAVEEMVTTNPERCMLHDRQHGARDVHRAEQQRLDLIADLLRTEFLEEASEEVACVVYEDVEATELRDGGLDGRLRVLRAGNV